MPNALLEEMIAQCYNLVVGVEASYRNQYISPRLSVSSIGRPFYPNKYAVLRGVCRCKRSRRGEVYNPIRVNLSAPMPLIPFP